MGLITCPDCQKEVSGRARVCPHCGGPLRKETIVDLNMHGRGEGIFMKFLNCGCMVALALAALVAYSWYMANRDARVSPTASIPAHTPALDREFDLARSGEPPPSGASLRLWVCGRVSTDEVMQC